MNYRCSPQQSIPFHKLWVDNFAGGGGASTGIEGAIGRPVDIAINHDMDAIEMHKVNHPTTHHYCESVFDIDPIKVTRGFPIEGVWLSPDCRHFSKAKGSAPVSKKIRGLAWITLRWAARKPEQIYLENVEEFVTWGPLIAKRDPKTGRVVKRDKTIAAPGERVPVGEQLLVPCPKRKGDYFKRFISLLRALGYVVDFRNLSMHEYGVGTIRKRFFMVARCDGLPVQWPQKTHGSPKVVSLKKAGLKKQVTAYDIIDWSLPVTSIFDRAKPIAENTLKRIINGMERFVFGAPEPLPFIVRIGQQGFGGDRMAYSIHEPLTTITSKAEHLLIIPYIGREIGKGKGLEVVGDGWSPLVSSSADCSEQVVAFLIKYYGAATGGVSIHEPLHTVTSKERLALVTIHLKDGRIFNIGMRMIKAFEMFRAHSFPQNYIIDRDSSGRKVPEYKQVARCGNSVPPKMAELLVAANRQPVQLVKVA